MLLGTGNYSLHSLCLFVNSLRFLYKVKFYSREINLTSVEVFTSLELLL